MLTVCIPVYNQFIDRLVKELYSQINGSNYEAEILVIDDASAEEYKTSNKVSCENKARYIELDENIGRARIRNIFPQYASFDYLLYLDCDSHVTNSNFLQEYITLLKEKSPKVVFGGSTYFNKKPPCAKRLRWKYGLNRESKPATERKANPHKSFKTNNFIVHRSVFEKVKFDERIKGYGHEDTLFGFELRKHQIPVMHVDNFVFNAELDTNFEFLRKTDEGIITLMFVLKLVNGNKQFIKDVILLRFVDAIIRKKIFFIIYLNAIIFRKLLRLLLKNGVVSVKLFNVYKLLFAVAVIKKQNMKKFFID